MWSFPLFIFCWAPLSTASLLLNAAGSSIANGLYMSSALAYGVTQPDVTIKYVGLGSAKGICRIQNITQKCAANDRASPQFIDFATAEALELTAQDYSEYPDIQMYPVAASAIVPIFNLGNVTNMTLSISILAQIFRGEVLFWDDWRIKALNPNFSQWNIPSGKPIKLAVRSDTGGATQVFKRALSSDPVFKAQMGTSGAPNWPNVTTIKFYGNQAIVAYVLTTPFALGYADLGSALTNNLAVPRLLKDKNYTVTAHLSGIEYALLELGLSFGNNGDDSSHLTADLVNAAGPNAWPIVGYNYVIMRKNTLRPGATCSNLHATLDFWYWFWNSDVAGNFANEQSYVLLPPVVREAVWARMVSDIRCEGQLVWQSEASLAVAGQGSGLPAQFLRTIAKVYNADNSGVSVTYTSDAEAGGQTDLHLDQVAFGAATEPGLDPPTNGVKLVFAGVGLVAVSQMTMILSGEVLANILEGSITTWLDDALMALNPAGITNSSGGVLSDPTLQIQLLQGPMATSDEMDRQMRRYLPTYTGAAIRAATVASSEDMLRTLLLAFPLSLAVTPLTGVFPSSVNVAPLRRNDGGIVVPSWESVMACAQDTFNTADVSFRLWESQSPNCYPLAASVHIRVRRSQCDLVSNAIRTSAVSFVDWLLTDSSTANALESASLAPLLDATPEAQRVNRLALSFISCNPTSTSMNVGLIAGIAAGVGGAALIGLVALIVWHRRGQRNNSAAPKDPSQPFCVLFTDIESSTHLWATVPAQMACALDAHHTLMRKLISEHAIYEVKTIGDSFMCATPDPCCAVAFAISLQDRFFRHCWGDGRAVDNAYEEKGLAETLMTKKVDVPKDEEVWNGLRVRVGIHYGQGDIKLDPVSQGYDYYGTVVNTAARIESVCHGGQIGVSQAVHDAVGCEVPSSVWTDLGPQWLRGLTEPLRLYQVLPAGPLARRVFPPLRLERGGRWEDDVEEASVTSGSLTMTTNTHVFNPDHHPLVQRGDVTAPELLRQYGIATATLQTLLATQTPAFAEATLKAICSRLKVKYYGNSGARQALTLHWLVMRLLPGTVTAALGEAAPPTEPLPSSRTHFSHPPQRQYSVQRESSSGTWTWESESRGHSLN